MWFIMANGRGTRKLAKRMKPEDTHRFLRLRLTHDSSGTDNIDYHWADIGRLMSQINRRFYRQGGTYHIANISILDTDGDVDIQFSGLPTTWCVKAAWRKAFELWKQQRASVQDVTPLSSKWADFKIFMNNASRTWDFLNFTDSQGDAMGTGDWSYSKMFLDEDGDNTDDFFLHMMGANDGSLPGGTCNSASLLANYEDVLQIPQQAPELPDNANISLFTLMSKGGEGTELNNDLVDYMETDNDEPPYSTELVPGAKTASGDPWVYREVSIKTAQAPSVMIPGFAVPLGLLAVKTTSSTDDNVIDLIIELVPGKYKGIQYESWA